MRHLVLCLTLLFSPFVTATSIEVGFSPSGTALALVLRVIDDAQETLDVEAYSFTSKDVATALTRAAARGVKVRVVADAKSHGSKYSALTFLANHQVSVRLNDRYAIMHNKVMIADHRHVKTGSFNYSAAANKSNAENVLVIRDQPALARAYLKEFERLWAEGKRLEPTY
ncbi:TPA: phospholipase D family protein [Klebsiella pneumoniae]|uniref:phospholipase D family nuclease n=1 Tax=Klebsiella quasipneumoniae TaxID=1463165 RepID=UPI0007A03A5C|nr:phospholipase D family protein [Klebsiella quasipneumoniae]EKW0785079.1 phospholipase D family protein [Klebsiella michiganensis]KYZ74206.1 endonuclease [Klebsiella quasipneumoniae subsp. similipneumoniae]HBQ8671237.1 phospholipase D family protein [Klebsiella pneumoniae]